MPTNMAYDARLIEKIMPQIQNYKVRTGRDISPDILESLIRAQLDVASDKSMRAYEFGESKKLQERGLALQEQAAADAASAAKVKGVTDLGTTAGMLALASRALKKPPVPPVPGAQTAVPAVSGLGPEGIPMAGAPAYTPPPVGAQAALSGTAAPAVPPPSPAAPAVTEGGGAAVTSGGGFPVMPALSGAAAVYAAQKIAPPVLEKVGVPTEVAKGFSAGGATGAIAGGAEKVVGGDSGEAIRWVVDPVGSLVSEATGGTVICTELSRQGLLSRRLQYGAHFYRKWYVDAPTHAGYTLLATPIVARMQRGGIVNRIMRPIGMAMAREMAFKVGVYQHGSRLGRLILRLGIPLCRWVGSKQIVLAEVR